MKTLRILAVQRSAETVWAAAGGAPDRKADWRERSVRPSVRPLSAACGFVLFQFRRRCHLERRMEMRNLIGLGLACLLLSITCCAGPYTHKGDDPREIDGLRTDSLPDPENKEGHDEQEPLGPLVLQLAEIKLENGNTVTFAEVGHGSMLISEGGDSSTSPILDKYLERADSPAHLARLLSAGTSISAEFEAASRRVVAANNWKVRDDSVQKNDALDNNVLLLQDSPSASSSSSSWCTGAGYAFNAWYGQRAGNEGGNLWYLENGHQNWRSRNDVLAVKGKVCVISGTVRWRLSRRNCNLCNYYTIWDRTIDANQWYYAYSYDNRNDFKIRSLVEGKFSGQSFFRHSMSTCHDYHVRTIFTSSLKAGCHISGPGAGYSIGVPTLGVDPSNIYTSGYWS